MAKQGREILRLGGLYTLARRFGILGMQGLVLKKISCGVSRLGYCVKQMLGMTRQVFGDIPGNTENAAAILDEEVGDEGGNLRTDPLKVWLINWLGENMMQITSGGLGEDYWSTLKRVPGLLLAVSRARIVALEDFKGELVKVEDHDDEREDGVK